MLKTIVSKLFTALSFILIIFAFNFFNLFAEINLKDDVVIKHSDLNYIDISFCPTFKGFDTLILNSQQYLNPKIEGCITPNNLSYGAPIEITKTIIITVLDSKSFAKGEHNVNNIINYSGIIAPKPFTFFDSNSTSVEYKVDETLYSNYQPNQWVEVKYLGIAGCRHIASVTFLVARYNPDKQSIEIPKEINVVINFHNKNNNNLSTNVKNDIETTVNHNETRSWAIPLNQKYYDSKSNK